MTNDPVLPSKCCAKCGFLYGLARRPASRDDAVFDPDLLRSEELERNYMPQLPGHYARGVITSQPYTKVVTTTLSEKLEAGNFTWADTLSICCYWRKFTHHISALKGPLYGDAEFQYVPIESIDVISTIRQDRSDCDSFFEYFAGLSPKQHAEMRLEERREEIARQHEKKLAEWSATQESRWQRISLELDTKQNEQETKRRERDARLTKLATWLTVGLLFFTGIQTIAAIVQVLK